MKGAVLRMKSGDLADPDERLLAISETLTGARQAATALPGFPGELPETFAEAYEIQRLSRVAWPDQVAGWKVGGVPSAFIEHFNATRLTGPIFASSVVRVSQGQSAKMPVFDGGFGAIEPEFIVELGETRAHDRMFIGAEIASSPIPAINDVGPIAVISDFGNNNGLLLGPEIEDWKTISPCDTVVETHIDGKLIASRTLDSFWADAGKALSFMIDHARTHEIELTPGTFVSTGAITGVHEAGVGAKSTLDFGQFGNLELTLVKAEPAA